MHRMDPTDGSFFTTKRKADLLSLQLAPGVHASLPQQALLTVHSQMAPRGPPPLNTVNHWHCCGDAYSRAAAARYNMLAAAPKKRPPATSSSLSYS
jgi:hypothetical protein